MVDTKRLVLALLAGLPALAGMPVFVDAAASSGLSEVLRCGSDGLKNYIVETLGSGAAFFDYDGDGLLDILLLEAGQLTPDGISGGVSRLYRNRGNGKFDKVAAGLEQSGWAQGVCAADFDNDGWTDLFITYWGRNRLYRNTGNGRFEDVSRQFGIPQAEGWSTGCAFVDYDRDGFVDLFVAGYIAFDRNKVPLPGVSPTCRWKGFPVLCGPVGLPGGTNHLLRNREGRRFEDVTHASGVGTVTPTYSLSVTTLDYDLDGWPDIYVAVDSRPSLLFRNLGNGTFREVGVSAGVAFSEDGREQSGMGSSSGDWNGDGYPDLVKTNFIDDTVNLYRNAGDGSFEDAVHSAGMAHMKSMGWGVGLFDFDNDGRPDVFIVNGHVYPELEAKMPGQPYRQRPILYRNLDGKSMRDVTSAAGPALSQAHVARGLAWADFDNDGDIDLLVNNMNEAPSLFRNEARGSQFLSLRLAGTRSNAGAIGARVVVRTGGLMQSQEVRSGSSFLSQPDLRLHFGLGQHTKADRIDIYWPTANSHEVFSGVAAGQFVTIKEGKGIVEARTSAR